MSLITEVMLNVVLTWVITDKIITIIGLFRDARKEIFRKNYQKWILTPQGDVKIPIEKQP